MPVKTPEISRLLMRFFLSLILFSAWAWARACVGLIGRRRLADNGPHVMGRTKRPEQAPQNAQKDRETNTPLHPIKIPIPPFNTSHRLPKNVDLENISWFSNHSRIHPCNFGQTRKNRKKGVWKSSTGRKRVNLQNSGKTLENKKRWKGKKLPFPKQLFYSIRL